MQRPTPLRNALRAAAIVFATTVALASPHTAHAYMPSAVAPDAPPNESDLDNHHTYVNRDGQSVHSPAHTRSGRAPAGASARCRDGTYSFSRHHGGTCSRHGGVDAWL